MARAGKRTERREIPHEPGHFMTFRTLSGAQLDEADTKGTLVLAEQLKAMPDRIVDRSMEQDVKPEDIPLEREFRGYDSGVLCAHGIAGWECPTATAIGTCDVCAGSYWEEPTPERITELDAMTRNWAAWEIFRMNKRAQGESLDSGSTSPTATMSPTS